MQRFVVPLIPVRTLVTWTVGVVAIIGCFWLLIRFQSIVLLFLTAVILSTAVHPPVIWLEKRGINKQVGTFFVIGMTGLLLGLLFWFSLPVIAKQGGEIVQTLIEGYDILRTNLAEFPNILVQRLLFVLPNDITLLSASQPADLNGTGSERTLTAADQSRRLFTGIFQLIAIVILTFYWTLEGERIKRSAFLLVPIQKRNNIRDLISEIESKVSGYILGQGMLCLIIGITAFVAYLLIGLPDALLLAVFAGLLEAVPIIGPFIGAVPAIIVGLSISPLTAFWVILATLVIQQLEGSLLVPRVMNRAIGVRPLVTLLALLAFGSLFGVLGALVALPLAAVIQLLMDRFLLSRESLEEIEQGRDRLSVLRYETNQLVQDVRSQFRQKEEAPSALADELEDEVEAIALDLESFLLANNQVET
jgi:predicted PurR-regulated permease PerM